VLNNLLHDFTCRIHLLTSSSRGTASRHPGYYVDGPYAPATHAANEMMLLESSNVDTLGRPCPAYRIYGFPAYYGYGPPLQQAGEMVPDPGCYFDVPPHCVNCRGAGIACPEHGRGAPVPAGYGVPPGEEIFIDLPPGQGGPEGTERRRRSRPPTEGNDSENTPVRTFPLLTPNCGGVPVWKSPDHEKKNEIVRPSEKNKPPAADSEEDEWTYVDFQGETVEPRNHGENEKRPDDHVEENKSRGTVEPPSPRSRGYSREEEGKRPDHEDEEGPLRRVARPDGQSPDSVGGGDGTEPMTKTGTTTTASCSTLSDLDNRFVMCLAFIK